MKKLLFTCLCLFSAALGAQELSTPVAAEASPQQSAVERDTAASPAPAPHEASDDFDPDPDPFPDTDNKVVSIGQDATLAAGEKAVSVVAILGSATSAGEVADEVVSVLGNARVTGPVGDKVVAVLGNSFVNSRTGGDAVAVLGNIELGPQADIGGNVVAIGGNLTRSPGAVIRGSVQNVGGYLVHFDWLHSWIKECLLYGRPLALAPDLGWAWGLALGFLALYVLLALLFRTGIDRCVQTLETQPGRSILTAFLTLLITPILFVLLCITVIGIAVVPFLGLGIFLAGLFGKAVMLAWIGRRFTRFAGESPFAHTAVAVLIGGVIVLALYLVPILGFIVYKTLGILGLGVVVSTLILSAQRNRISAAPAAAAEAAPEVAPLPVEPEPPLEVTGEAAALPRAGFWIRLAALFLDVVLVGIVLSLAHNSGKLELLGLAVYGAMMWKLRGTTIGGIICGLKVVRLDGRPIDWPVATVRALGCFLSLAIAGLGFLWIVFDAGKQAWHDKIAGTAVVRTPKGISLL
jgi:uncharacterized RDD family membrane protein YckC